MPVAASSLKVRLRLLTGRVGADVLHEQGGGAVGGDQQHVEVADVGVGDVGQGDVDVGDHAAGAGHDDVRGVRVGGAEGGAGGGDGDREGVGPSVVVLEADLADVGEPSVAPPVGVLRVIGTSSSMPSTVGSLAIGMSTVRLVWPSAKETVVLTGRVVDTGGGRSGAGGEGDPDGAVVAVDAVDGDGGDAPALGAAVLDLVELELAREGGHAGLDR